MYDISALNVVMRVLHVTGAVMAVGGAIFAAWVVLPGVHILKPEDRENFHGAARKRAVKLVMVSILMLLVSGFHNYIRIEMPRHAGQAAYNAIMGAKILLAFAVFFIASALTGRSPAFAKMREARKRWMRLQILLSLIIIVLAAILRSMPHQPA